MIGNSVGGVGGDNGNAGGRAKKTGTTVTDGLMQQQLCYSSEQEDGK